MTHLNAALQAVRRSGRPAERAKLVHARASTLVRVDPGPVAVRLAGWCATFRDQADSAAREARIASAVAAAGAPALAPLEPARDGVTLWPWVETVAEAGDAAQAGRTLRACHEALAGMPLDREPLWLLHEARRLAETAETRDALDASLAELRGAPVRPVHGDPHPGNILWTADGPLWGDWEDAQLAPIEWDFACLVNSRTVDFGWSDAALDAHAGTFDAELLDACLRARRAQGAAVRQAFAHLEL